MALSAKLRRAPGRIAAGAFVLNSGLGKLKGDEQTAQFIHGFATGAYPFLAKVPPKVFLRALGATEVAVGGALLMPLIPAGLAGLALTGFSGGLLGLYARTPSLHDEYYRPTQDGIPISKDLWLAAIGTGLVVDAALSESPITNTDD